MNIAIDISYLNNKFSFNTATYLISVFSKLAQVHRQDQFFLISNEKTAVFILPSNMQWLLTETSQKTNWWNRTRNERKFRKLLQQNNITVLVSANGYLPKNSNCKTYLLVEHWMLQKYAGMLPELRWQLLKKKWKSYLDEAHVVITFYENVKQQLADEYSLPSEKIRVLPFAINNIGQPLTPDLRQQKKLELTAGSDYFIYAGDIHPGENFINLLKAFSFFKKRLHSNMKLLLVSLYENTHTVFDKALTTFRFREEVILLKETDEQNIISMIASAYAFVCPVFAGDNEKMVMASLSCGIPVITTRHPVMQCIAGEAGVYFSEDSYDALAEKLCLLYKDETLRNRMTRQALMQNQANNIREVLPAWEMILTEMKHTN